MAVVLSDGLKYSSNRISLIEKMWGVLSSLRAPNREAAALGTSVSLPHISLNSIVDAPRKSLILNFDGVLHVFIRTRIGWIPRPRPDPHVVRSTPSIIDDEKLVVHQTNSER